MHIEIIPYARRFEDALMDLIRREGPDWDIYWGETNAAAYRKSLETSATYLALADGTLCGYSRSIRDALFFYVCDLLVNEAYRGHGIGEKLLRRLQEDEPGLPVYIMSGNDGYYEKKGCKKEGSIYLLA